MYLDVTSRSKWVGEADKALPASTVAIATSCVLVVVATVDLGV